LMTEGGVWQLKLSHEEVGSIADGLNAAGSLASIFTASPWLEGILGAISGVLVAVDAIGLNHGVNVVGVLQTQFVTVTPAIISIDWVKRVVPELQEATGLPGGVIRGGLGAGVALLAVGPAGVVLGGLAGWLLPDIINSDGPNPGDVYADRHEVGPWEKFVLVALTPNHVAIASWRGYFSAENGGGGAVHANRRDIADWETVILIRNPNGTVSLQHPGGHFLVAENGGGDGAVCNWNRTTVGDWEQFWMEFQPGGTFALKTFSKGTYVSVQ
jgi:hypothetical protein